MRLHLMPMAVGIYLPLSLSTPIFLGGLIRHLAEKKKKKTNEGEDQGVLLSSGLIAGEALMGIFIALLLTFELNPDVGSYNSIVKSAISFACFFAVMVVMKKKAVEKT